MNKGDITNLISVLIMAYGYSNGNELVFMVGLFALSGAVTNSPFSPIVNEPPSMATIPMGVCSL